MGKHAYECKIDNAEKISLMICNIYSQRCEDESHKYMKNFFFFYRNS